MIFEQPSAYFINIMKENYVLKPNLSGVQIFLATDVLYFFQETRYEIKHKLNVILPAFTAALVQLINDVKSRLHD